MEGSGGDKGGVRGVCVCACMCGSPVIDHLLNIAVRYTATSSPIRA